MVATGEAEYMAVQIAVQKWVPGSEREARELKALSQQVRLITELLKMGNQRTGNTVKRC